MAEEIPPAESLQPEPLSVLWRVFSAPQTLLLLMGLLALTLALGTWIPQIPSHAAGNPEAWLATQPRFLGQENSLVRALSLYDLYHTFWFRLLLILTGLVLFVRAVDAAELAWHMGSRRGRPAGMPLPWQSSLPVQRVDAPRPLAETAFRLEEYLGRQGYRHSEVPLPESAAPNSSPVRLLVAGRHRPVLWARPAGYGALLLALVGLFLATSWGWQEAPVQLLPGESRPVGHDTPLAYRLDAFQLHINNRGQLAGYRSEISWLEGQAQVGQGVVSIGQPARRTGVALHQAGFVPVIRLSAQDEAGQPLLLESSDVAAAGVEEMLVRFSLPEDQPLVFLPHLNRFLALSFEPLCSIDRPAVHVDLLDEAGTSRQRLGSLSSSGALPLGDGQLLAELSYAPILRLESRPALGLALVAALLALLALALAWVRPARLAWLAVLPAGEDGSSVEITALAGAGQRLWLSGFAGGLEEALQDAD